MQTFRYVTGVIMQGDGETHSWVTAFSVQTSLDGRQWKVYDPRDEGDAKGPYTVDVHVLDGESQFGYALPTPEKQK